MSNSASIPSETPCPKCGSLDIARQFFREGDDESITFPNPSNKVSSDFVNRTMMHVHPVLKDCISHRCEGCYYCWDTAPMNHAHVQKDLNAAAVGALTMLDEYQRTRVFALFCTHCGSDAVPCHCSNDE